MTLSYRKWRAEHSGTLADYQTYLSEGRYPVTTSLRSLVTLMEYATATDGEVAERGLNDLNEVMPEIRRVLGMPWQDPDDHCMEGQRR